jgi:hypothetical protein
MSTDILHERISKNILPLQILLFGASVFIATMASFQRFELDLTDKDMWDDNALIEAYDKSIREYQQSRQDPAFSKKKKREMQSEASAVESTWKSPRNRKRPRLERKGQQESPSFETEVSPSFPDPVPPNVSSSSSAAHPDASVSASPSASPSPSASASAYASASASASASPSPFLFPSASPFSFSFPPPFPTYASPSPAIPPAPAQAANISFTPEEMSNLLLSWYYAGYWTGRYFKQFDN